MTDATATATTPEEGLRTSFLVRVTLVFIGWTTLHVALLGALLWRSLPGGWWSALALFLVALAPLPFLLRSFRDDAYPSAATRVFVMRPFWYVQLGLPLVSLTTLLAFLVGLPFGAGLAAARAAAPVVLGFLALGAFAGWLGSRHLVVRRHTFAFADLPPAFDGVTIAQLSDLHVGPQTSARFLARIVRAVEDAKPDLVAFTGDQVDDYDQDVARFADVFGGLRAPLGVFAIAGNHDVYAGWPGVRDGMAKAGMQVLVNDAVTLRRGEDEVWLAGTGDPAALQFPSLDAVPDIEKTMAKVPAGAFAIVLAHNPALWRLLAPRGARLTLSGHTHHGQISVPALKWCLASPFVEHAIGPYFLGDAALFIHPGTNYWALPLRLGAWPEVSLVTLRRGAGPGAP